MSQRPLKVWTYLVFSTIFIGLNGLPLFSQPIYFDQDSCYSFKYLTHVELLNFQKNSSTGFDLSGNIKIKVVFKFENEYVLRIEFEDFEEERRNENKIESLEKSHCHFHLRDGKVEEVFSEKLPFYAKSLIGSLRKVLHLVDKNSEKCKVTKKIEKEGKVNLVKDCGLEVEEERRGLGEVFEKPQKRVHEQQVLIEDDLIKSFQSNEEYEIQSKLDPSQNLIIRSSQSLKFYEIIKQKTENKDLKQVLEKMPKENEGSISWRTKYSLKSVLKLMTSNEKLMYSSSRGTRGSSQIFLELIERFRTLDRKELREIVKWFKQDDIYKFVFDLLCAAQTEASLEVMFEETHEYFKEKKLFCLAFSTVPSLATLQHLYDISNLKNSSSFLDGGTLASLGAVLRTTRELRGVDRPLIYKIQNLLLERVSPCKNFSIADTSSCINLLIGIGNAGFVESIPVLMDVVEGSPLESINELALKALRKIRLQEVIKFKDRLIGIMTQKMRPYSSSVRVIAFQILEKLDLTSEELFQIFHFSSKDPFFKQHLIKVMKANPKFCKKLRGFFPSDVLFFHDNSIAFSSSISTQPHIPYFLYMEYGRDGLLRKSGMHVDLDSDLKMNLYKFDLFVSGLGSLVGDLDTGEEKTAGLSLDILGVILKRVTFLSDQSDLMSLLWSLPSEPIHVIENNFLVHDYQANLKLANGFEVQLQLMAGISLDVAGFLTYSIWNRNAKTAITTKGALSMESSLKVFDGISSLSLSSSRSTSTALDFVTDLDFYDKMKMCIQMQRRSANSESKIKRVKVDEKGKMQGTEKIFRWSDPGVCLPLPSSNYRSCRKFL